MESVEILQLLRAGWRPWIKGSKRYEYLSLRRSSAGKEIPLGRKIKATWRFVQANQSEGEVAHLASNVHALEQLT